VVSVAILARVLTLLTRGDPWFLRRPRATVAVAVAMFAVIFVARLVIGGAADDICLLYTLPIALLAVAFGMRAGVPAGLAGVGLVVVWVMVDGVSLSPVGWASRIAPMLLLGFLLGDAIDRLRRAEHEQRRLEEAARRQRDAIEINDTIVQGMSAAKWALESGDLTNGLAIVSDTLALGHRLVSELIRDADMQQRWSGTPAPPIHADGSATQSLPASRRRAG
jgi:hypothetical protein